MKRTSFKQEQLKQELDAVEAQITQLSAAPPGDDEDLSRKEDRMRLLMAQREKVSRKLRELQLNQVRQRNFRERKKGKTNNNNSTLGRGANSPPPPPPSSTVLSSCSSSTTSPLPVPPSSLSSCVIPATVISGKREDVKMAIAVSPPEVGKSTTSVCPFYYAFPTTPSSSSSSSPSAVISPMFQSAVHQPAISLFQQEQRPPILIEQRPPIMIQPIQAPQKTHYDSAMVLVQSISGSEQEFSKLVNVFRTSGNLSLEEQLTTSFNLSRLRRAYLDDCACYGPHIAKLNLSRRILSSMPASAYGTNIIDQAPSIGFLPQSSTTMHSDPLIGIPAGLQIITGDSPIVEITGSKEIGLENASDLPSIVNAGSGHLVVDDLGLSSSQAMRLGLAELDEE
eukprot:TRINITY_DN15179_c0_g1_i1.p1 TRINITY_DN15179_c0_g1~~TRINITY_DN15179_c0_g1_i1.p1  ORF type:complete len:395 (+),score=70.33 TRINITY_DN15179_c0_g1_i1:148-1332(+)